jgi:hypothetical protein
MPYVNEYVMIFTNDDSTLHTTYIYAIAMQ